MFATILSMIIILALACVVVGMVVVGLEGNARHRLPEIANTLAVAGKYLNGEAAPPAGLLAFLEEAESGAEDLRALTARRVSSARSGATAGSGASAPTTRSAESPSGFAELTVPKAVAPVPSAVPASRFEPPVSLPQSVSPAGQSAWADSGWEQEAVGPLSPMDAFVTATPQGGSVWATWTPPDAKN